MSLETLRKTGGFAELEDAADRAHPAIISAMMDALEDLRGKQNYTARELKQRMVSESDISRDFEIARTQFAQIRARLDYLEQIIIARGFEHARDGKISRVTILPVRDTHDSHDARAEYRAIRDRLMRAFILLYGHPDDKVVRSANVRDVPRVTSRGPKIRGSCRTASHIVEVARNVHKKERRVAAMIVGAAQIRAQTDALINQLVSKSEVAH